MSVKKPPTAVKPGFLNLGTVSNNSGTTKNQAGFLGLDPQKADPSSTTAIDPLSPDSVDAVLAGIRNLTTYDDNVLNKFDNSTYHIRLFMTPDRDVLYTYYQNDTPKTIKEYYDLLDKFQQVTIAETGATGYNITGLQVESLVGPNFQSVALNTTSMTMGIVEPMGVGFLDSMKRAALDCQVRDVRKCWYYVEVTFKGYDNGTPLNNLLTNENFQNGGRWIWRVQITDIETKLSAGGGEYKLSMIPYSEVALDADTRCIPDMITVEGDTIGDFFDDLTIKLNDAWELRSATNNFRVYEFVFHGIKGKVDKIVDGPTVRGYSLNSLDEQLDYIRHLDASAETVSSGVLSNGTKISNEVAVSPALKSGQTRATSEQLAAAVKKLIPGVVVTSGRRTPLENAKNRGVAHSQHIDGTAIDIRTPNISTELLKKQLADMGYQVDVIHETATDPHSTGDHYHIQGARYLPKNPNVTPTDAPQEANTVPAPDEVTNPADSILSQSPTSGKMSGQFLRGTSIEEIVTSVFGSCQDSQNLAKDSYADPNSPDDVQAGTTDGQVNSKGFRESVVFRVEPEVRVLTYDPLFNKYGMKVKLHIYGYVSQTPIISRTQIIAANDVNVQKKMITSLVKQNLLKKKYDYLYTGLNSSIIDLDLTFNVLWAVALPRLIRNEALTAQTRYDQSIVDAYQESQDVVAKYGSLADDRSAALAAYNSAINDYSTAVANGDTDAAKTAQDAANTASQQVTNLDSQLSTASSQVNGLRARLLAALPTLNEASLKSGGRVFAEDITSAQIEARGNWSIAMEYIEDGAVNSLAAGMMGQYHNGRSIYGTIMNQLEGAMTSQMLSISMKIVGDPYWLGPANLEQTIIRANNLSTDKVADYTVGDNVFTLEFAYPLGTNDAGQPVISKSEMFTGLYRVTTVSHDFSDGRFTQNLQAIRMPLVDLFKATADNGTTTS